MRYVYDPTRLRAYIQHVGPLSGVPGYVSKLTGSRFSTEEAALQNAHSAWQTILAADPNANESWSLDSLKNVWASTQ